MCERPRSERCAGQGGAARRAAACWVVLVVAAAVLAGGCGAPQAGGAAAGKAAPGGKAVADGKAAAGGTLTVPAILPLTGPSADLGRSVAQGMRLAEADLALAGRPYRLRVEDSQGAPDKALSAYSSLGLFTSSRVVLSWMSLVGRALAPRTHADGRVLFVGAALDDLVGDDGQVVRVWPNATAIGQAMGTFAAARGLRRVAILYVDDDYGRAVAAAFQRVLEHDGGRVVAREPLSLQQTDYRSPCMRLKRAAPDGLYIPAYGDAYSSGLRQIREVFGARVPVLADFPLLSSFTLPRVGAAAEGVLVPATQLDVEPRPTSAAQAFAARYLARYHMPADFNSGLGYMMLTIAARALDAASAGGDPAAAIRGRAFAGPLGDLRYDARNDCTLPIVIARIQQGRARRVQ